MAYIKTLKNEDLITDSPSQDTIYPVSTTQAIYNQASGGACPEGVKAKLEDRLVDHENDAKLLHRESEKLVLYINNTTTGGKVNFEIRQNQTNTLYFECSANIETFGDEPAEKIAFPDASNIPEGARVLHSYYINVNSDTPPRVISTYKVECDYDLPDTVGSYYASFQAAYPQTTEKEVGFTVNVNLRKYFGFMASEPAAVEELAALVSESKATSDFSNSVGCTVVIPVNSTGEQFKKIYFAVPEGMSINRIVQPDALNAPLAFTQLSNITRTVNGTTYTYKLYQSTDFIDSTNPKRLTIS